MNCFTSYKTGQRYPELVSRGAAPRMGVGDGGIVLVHALDGATPEEVRLFRSGNRLDITADRFDDVLVMTFQFGGKERRSHGCDVTYTPHIGRPPHLGHLDRGQGYSVQMLLVDGMGTILAQRLVGLSTEMSRAIRDIVRDIASKPFDADEYRRTLRKVYGFYSPYELRQRARHRYAVGGRDGLRKESL